MIYQEWQNHKQAVYSSLEKKELKNAFDLLRVLIAELRDWGANEQLNDYENTYKIMLRYMQDGIKDPDRNHIHEDLLRSAYELADSVMLKYRDKNATGYYFDRKRVFHTIQTENLEETKLHLDDVSGKITLNNLLKDDPEKASLNLEKELESANIKLFNYIWLSNKWTAKENEIISDLITNPIYPEITRSLLISAVILNLQVSFDENKFFLLLNACDNSDEEIRQRAITGLLITLRQYDKRLYLYPEINNRLQHLAEDLSFVINIRNIILQFILSKDTEKITKKIQEEIIPEMMKIKPVLNKKINPEELMNESGIDEKNPEWQNIIMEESELSNKLQEFSELQLEGADVMHSSFAHLKSYPFFNEISNWFLPFTTLHSVFYSTFDKKTSDQMLETLNNSAYLCNSDKYSLYLSISQMPESYRKMVANQFAAETEAIKEMQASDLPDDKKKMKRISNLYIHDLYRFYKLNPHRKDFDDIFEIKPEFYETSGIGGIISDIESLKIIGEYYFTRNYFSEALKIFDKILEVDSQDDVIYQKKGYALQMTGRIKEALDSYLKAELLNASNTWTIKKIAYCYRMLKMPDEALIYYRKVEQTNPDNLSVLLSIGHCYLELKEYNEALKCYFKVEYLDSKSNRAWRPIAWCSFLTGKYSQAIDYFDKILSGEKPDASDFLNAGHVQLALGNVKEAILYYVRSVKKTSFTQFTEIFYNDLQDLLQAGIAGDDIPFILDQVRYLAD